jgi:hypothetical protein
MRIALVGLSLAAVGLAALTAGCLGPNPADGTLTGHLYGVGGPSPGALRPWPGTVTITGPGVHIGISVGASGTYSVQLPAGRYTVGGSSPNYESGAALCRAAGTVIVTRAHRTRADVLCEMS